jgi:hypothetical protein
MLWRINFISCVILLMAVEKLSAQDKELSVDKDHIIGVIEAHIANVESWRSGDFLVRIRNTNNGRLVEEIVDEKGMRRMPFVEGQNAKSVLSETNRVHRVRFDFDRQNLFIANRSERRDQVYDSLDREIGNPQVVSDDRALVLQRSRAIGASRLEAAVVHRLVGDDLPELETALDQFGAPHVRFIGFSVPILWTGGYLEQKFDQVRREDDIIDISNVGKDRYQVLYRFDIDPANRIRGQRYYYDWDMKRNVPLKHRLYPGHDVGDHPEGDKPLQVGNSEWKEMDGANLPISARYSLSSFKRVNGQEFRFAEEWTVEVHWFSINKELPEEHFTEEVLHDRKKLDELLDTSVFDNEKGKRNSE